jgi:hypothetical protein
MSVKRITETLFRLEHPRFPDYLVGKKVGDSGDEPTS